MKDRPAGVLSTSNSLLHWHRVREDTQGPIHLQVSSFHHFISIAHFVLVATFESVVSAIKDGSR